MDGFLLASEIEPEVFDFLRESNLPAVFLGDHPSPAEGLSKVHGNNEYGAYLATRHLLELGHRRIAFMGDYSRFEFYRLRFGGYCRALLEASLEIDQELVWDVSRGEKLDRKLAGLKAEAIGKDGYPTAIFAASSHLALDVLEHLRAENIKIPEQLSIISYDDPFSWDRAGMNLTCVSISQETIGRVGLCRLLELIEQPQSPPLTTLVPVELIVRKSTAAPGDRG